MKRNHQARERPADEGFRMRYCSPSVWMSNRSPALPRRITLTNYCGNGEPEPNDCGACFVLNFRAMLRDDGHAGISAPHDDLASGGRIGHRASTFSERPRGGTNGPGRTRVDAHARGRPSHLRPTSVMQTSDSGRLRRPASQGTGHPPPSRREHPNQFHESQDTSRYIESHMGAWPPVPAVNRAYGPSTTLLHVTESRSVSCLPRSVSLPPRPRVRWGGFGLSAGERLTESPDDATGDQKFGPRWTSGGRAPSRSST